MSTTQAYYETGSTSRWVGKLTRDDGSPVPLADIDAATFILRDRASGAIVGGHGTAPATPRDVWNGGAGAHGFQFETGTDPQANGAPVTRVGWDIAVADVEPLSVVAARETHLGELVVDYHLGSGPSSTPKRIRHRHALECIDPRRLLCTIDDVLGYLKDVDPITNGAMLLRLIEAYGARAEAYCERKFLRSTVDQPSEATVSIECGSRVIMLDRYPVTQVVSVVEAVDGAWDDGLTLTAEDDYWLDAEGGTIEGRWRAFQGGAGAVRVRWVGGLFSDVSELSQDLREAIAQQVAFKWQRKGQLGLGSIGMQGTSITIEPVKDWLPDSRAVLDTLKRVEF